MGSAPERGLRVCLAPGWVGGGGIGMVTAALAEGLVAEGIDVDLLALDRPGDRPLPAEVRVIQVGPRVRQALLPTWRYLRAARPDAVIASRDHMNLLMSLGRLLSGTRQSTRLAWTFHSHAGAERLQPLASRLARVLAERLIRWPDLRVAVSHGVAEDLERRLGLAREEVRVIANPVWTAERLAGRHGPCAHPWLADRAPGDRRPDAPVILGIGRLVPQKDFATLLDAFALLAQDQPGARLIVLGEGPERAALDRQTRHLGLAGRVDLPGHVPDVLPFLSRADLFVLSSRWEGLPTALIEALGCGCRAVATDCPSGPKEILGEARRDRLVPPGDPSALASAMRRALDAWPEDEDLAAAALGYGTRPAARAYLAALGLVPFAGRSPGRGAPGEG